MYICCISHYTSIMRPEASICSHPSYVLVIYCRSLPAEQHDITKRHHCDIDLHLRPLLSHRLLLLTVASSVAEWLERLTFVEVRLQNLKVSGLIYNPITSANLDFHRYI